MATKKTIDRSFDVKTTSEDGQFSGYASVFGEIDSYRDIVVAGAFTKSLAQFAEKNRHVPMLWQHKADTPIGVYTVIREDSHGLYVEGACNMGVQQARECHALMKQGALTGLSIGYDPITTKWNKDDSTIELHEVKLWEISPVTFPAGDSARASVKSALDAVESLSDVEDILREAGFSRMEAKQLVKLCRTKSSEQPRDADLNVQLAGLSAILSKLTQE